MDAPSAADPRGAELRRGLVRELEARGSIRTESVRSAFLSVPREGYARCCEALRDADVTEELARIGAPLLVIGGADDPSVTPEEIGAMPGRHEILADAAHLASMERPDPFNELLTSHL